MLIKNQEKSKFLLQVKKIIRELIMYFQKQPLFYSTTNTSTHFSIRKEK